MGRIHRRFRSFPGAELHAGCRTREVTDPCVHRRSYYVFPLWMVAAFAIVLSAAPASAQAPNERWSFQGGPFTGVSIIDAVDLEYGFRIEANRGARVLDASISAFLSQFYVPPVKQWSFEALVGKTWHPSSNVAIPGFGFRAGLARVSNAFGEHGSHPVLGPHAAFGVPLGSVATLRGEAGVLVYWSLMGPSIPRGYFRFGVEAQKR